VLDRKDTIEFTSQNGGEYRIELDADEIFPDDPGQGTPVMVYGPPILDDREESGATYNCAIGEGVLSSYKYDSDPMPDDVLDWLVEQGSVIDEWFEEYSPK
jgi:hypothetical protein